MTLSRVPIESIYFDDSARQRTALVGIEELAASISQIGVLQPPVITREGQLIAGRRRLAAMSSLGWADVPVIYSDEIEPHRLELMELEENVKRVDLPWQDQVAAIVRYHSLRAAETTPWTYADSARELSCSEATVSNALRITKAMQDEPALEIAKAENYSTALGLARRIEERRKSNAVAAILGLEDDEPTDDADEAASGLSTGTEGDAGVRAEGDVFSSHPRPRATILNADFADWIGTNELRFNFVHCDFPYGVNAGDKKAGQSASKRLGTYDDSESVYWDLIDLFIENQDRFIADQAHLFFWHSMKHHDATKRLLTDAGWKIDPFPLIWHKTDNSGIVPDVERTGRRTYEACLFASRGDRKIVRPVAMSYGAPSPKELHTHEKHGEMLAHFFRMVVDSSTVMLDPTCGSGSAVKAAKGLGAALALGIEKDPEFAARAAKSLDMAT